MAKKQPAEPSAHLEIQVSMVPTDHTLQYRLSQLRDVIQRMLRRKLPGQSHDERQTAAQEPKGIGHG